MKMQLIRLVAVLVFVAGFVVFANAGSLDRPGWVVHSTDKTFKELNSSLNKSIKKHKMLRVTQASASAGAKGRGLTIAGNRIVGVYRNDYAIRMLEASIASGIEAPIRFYVTENPDGKTTLSYKTPTTVFSAYFEEGGDALKKLATELDGVFAAIAADAIQ